MRSSRGRRYTAELANGMFNATPTWWGYHDQYILRYVPAKNDTPKRFRTIKVQVPSLRMLYVRYRTGYYLTLRKEAGRSGKSAIKLWKLASDELS